MSDRNRKALSVFGLGYVGCVSAACLAAMGHHPIGVDANPRLGARTSGAGHIVTRGKEPVLQLLYAATELITLEDSFGNHQHSLGWRSNLLESRTPAWWLSVVCRAESPIVIATLICPAGGVTTAGLSAVLNGANIAVSWNDDLPPLITTIHIDKSADVAKSGCPWPLESGE